MSTNTITLNGKVYDSKTGSLVGGSAKALAHSLKKAPKTTIDTVKVAHPAKSTHSSRAHSSAHKTHHKVQKPKTLMRSAVKKPVISVPIESINSHALSHKETVSLFLPELSENRLKRAHEVHKSKLVTRFGSFGSQPTFVKKTAHVPVTPHPVENISQHQIAPVVADTDDIFTVGLQQATSHQQTHHTKHKSAHKNTSSSRKSSVAAAALAIVILGSFIAYQSRPNMEFRVAAARAGIHASLPGYHPSGFAMKGPIEYAPGQLTIRFQSNSDDRNFTISQKVSNWNSSALLDNYVASTDTNYQTIQDKGRTIYLYGDSGATWVDGGVWYQIEGSSSLNSTQLVKIASSI